MKSMTLHVSIIGHPNNGLSILVQCDGQPLPRVQDDCQPKPVSMELTSSFSSLMTVRDRAHSVPGGNFQYPQTACIITGLLEDQAIDPPFLLLIVDTTHILSLATGTTLQVSTPGEGGHVLIPLWKRPLKYTGYISVKMPLFGGLPCGFGYGNMDSEVWS